MSEKKYPLCFYVHIIPTKSFTIKAPTQQAARDYLEAHPEILGKLVLQKCRLPLIQIESAGKDSDLIIRENGEVKFCGESEANTRTVG